MSTVPFLLYKRCVYVLQITVSSGGMLVVKLDSNDLQFENFTNFDGTFAYAQNKVCQFCHMTHDIYLHLHLTPLLPLPPPLLSASASGYDQEMGTDPSRDPFLFDAPGLG